MGCSNSGKAHPPTQHRPPPGAHQPGYPQQQMGYAPQQPQPVYHQQPGYAPQPMAQPMAHPQPQPRVHHQPQARQQAAPGSTVVHHYHHHDPNAEYRRHPDDPYKRHRVVRRRNSRGESFDSIISSIFSDLWSNSSHSPRRYGAGGYSRHQNVDTDINIVNQNINQTIVNNNIAQEAPQAVDAAHFLS